MKVRNERCSQLPGSSYMLAYTGYNVFYKMTVKLPKGHHILQWYLFADPNSLQALWGPSESTMKIGQIAVTGTPPILRCTPCPAGTWGSTEGQAVCDTCPENTFSNTGAQKCEACSAVEYSSEFAGAVVIFTNGLQYADTDHDSDLLEMSGELN
ncbi:hypothetical protein EG68_12574 [Paragonimus skrjabini miyazakii]|uniref:Tyrosine-protein kinase ephrin type A/B receptor-like domain-containing protein n=1 Tax=Paragonimus skrjabini miyazakii TaxID=59628 RepID=A0A8S9YC83_9TREM|nr:hypothetical protein EG68_12574 [Paragonimus skrjabini miyazakii]